MLPPRRVLMFRGVLLVCGLASLASSMVPLRAETEVIPSPPEPELHQLPGQEFLRQTGISLDIFADMEPFAGLEPFAGMDLGTTEDGSHLEIALRILQRLVQTPLAIRERLITRGLSVAALLDQPTRYRGALVELEGRVARVSERLLTAELAALTQFDRFYECELVLADGSRAVVYCHGVPRRWLAARDLDEAAAVQGVFVGRLPAETASPPRLWLIAPRMQWLPDKQGLVATTPSEQLLGALRFDVGSLDAVEQRAPLRAEEHDAFYGLLRAVEDVRRERLADLAQRHVQAFVAAAEHRAADVSRRRAAIEASREDEQLSSSPATEALTKTERQLEAIVREVRRRGAQQAYSVAPLFLDAGHYTGQLVLLEGIARRAIRIEIDAPGPANDNDSPMEHYFELEVFTPDSQRLPIVCCVSDLPADFPVGDVIAERVRIAGFFFKQWRFTSRRQETPVDAGVAERIAEAVPLVIGRGPIWIRPAKINGNPWLGLSLGGMFVALVAAVAWYLQRMHRRDREFRRRTLDSFYRS